MKWYWWAAIGVGVLVVSSQANRARVLNNLSKMKLGNNFTLDEFTRTSTGLDNIPGDKEIENLRALVKYILQPLRDYLGKPISISSGYRSSLVNEAVGGADSSQHSKGQAADFSVAGMTNQQIIDTIRRLNLPYDQLIDEQLNGKKWVHVSYNPAAAPRKEWLTARDDRPNKYQLIQRG